MFLSWRYMLLQQSVGNCFSNTFCYATDSGWVIRSLVFLCANRSFFTKKAIALFTLLHMSVLGIRSSVFWANCSFLPKNERMSNSLKNKRFAHSIIICEHPERFAHGCSFFVSDLSESLMVAHFWRATLAICSHRSFLVSDLSDLLTSLTKNEGMSESLIF